LTINGTSYSVIGVTAHGFSGDWVGWPVDAWIPAIMQSQVMSGMPGYLTARNGWVRILGRLRPGVTISQAQSASGALGIRTSPSEGVDLFFACINTWL
jgi:hypothetical protein